ncbi:MAG: hypothetical protein GIW95_07050 [Candidatus Eremiobacteraeota bacterium]|nr:hypothetical protein [Candidatus Eremiobacteraeota bacterium]
MSDVFRIVALAALAVAIPGAVEADVPATRDLDAIARAAGNRKSEAIRIGRVLFAVRWPAQLVKIRVDGAGKHEIAGLTLSGIKFHEDLDRRGFLSEVELLIARTFASAAVEEVDLWATVPIAYDLTQPVSGDLAVPTSRIVFAVTCRRSELGSLAMRLRTGDGVYWADDFRSRLRSGGA